MFAEVAVNLAQLNSVFDYQIPDTLHEKLVPGSLVLVPFGRQTLQGIVIAIRESSTFATIKPIQALLDSEPVLTPAQMKLAFWLSEETLTPLSQCLELMLPPGLSQHADTLYQKIEVVLPMGEKISPLQQRLLNLLAERGPMRGRQLERAFSHQNWKAAMQTLQRRGWVNSQAVLSDPTVKRKFIPAIRLIRDFPADLNLSKVAAVQQRRMSVLQFLASEQENTAQAWVIAQTGANISDIRLLQTLGYIEIVDQESIRDPLDHLSQQSEINITLTTEQDQILQTLKRQLEKPEKGMQPALLHGITGSGKTEIYLQLTQYVLDQNRQAIILVPEISLTPQTIRRFLNRFGEKIGVIHSRLTPGERYDTWRRIRSGEIKVVIGPRSALFAPVKSPALIILDECHDESYYQREPAPSYDSTAAAVQYAQFCHALVLLGSATPSIATFSEHNMKTGRSLPSPSGFPWISQLTAVPVLPPVEIVDMRQELKRGNRSMLSRTLQTALGEVLAKASTGHPFPKPARQLNLHLLPGLRPCAEMSTL